MDRGAWWATVYQVTKESDMTEQPSTVQHSSKDDALCLFCTVLKSRTGYISIFNFLNLVAIDDRQFHSAMKEGSIKKYDS